MCALFSPEILQARAVKGLKKEKEKRGGVGWGGGGGGICAGVSNVGGDKRNA